LSLNEPRKRGHLETGDSIWVSEQGTNITPSQSLYTPERRKFGQGKLSTHINDRFS